MPNTNVVQLNPRPLPASSARGSKPQIPQAKLSGPPLQLPAPLARIKERCSAHLQKLMAGFFERIDDTFFDLADQACNNSEQSSYFDAMRDIRLSKTVISRDFLEAYHRDFQFCPQPLSAGTVADLHSADLALVHNDDLEEQVAIDNIVSRLKSEAGQDLDHLTQRIAAMLPTVVVQEVSNPVGAQRLAGNFAAACSALELDIRSKLVVYKVFEKQVLSQIKPMLLAANNYLAGQGILPDLAAHRKPAGVGERSRQQSCVVGQRGNSAGQQDTSDSGATSSVDLMAMIAQLHQHMPDFNPPGVTATVLRQPSLVNALSVAQQSVAGAFAGSASGNSAAVASHRQENALPVNESGLINFVNLLQRMLRGDDGSQRARIGQADQDAINLVTMLFDFILEDRQLQAPVKALLGRLQIPLVKVALVDKSFFNSGGHVARRLLNELAMASVGWSEQAPGTRDPFLAKLEEVVRRVVDEFDDDVNVFSEALADFHLFQQAEKKRRVLVEQRTRDAEAGRAKTDGAKLHITNMLNGMLADHTTADCVVQMLDEGWRNYMVLLSLKHGIDHPQVSQAGHTAAMVIALTSPEGAAEPLSQQALTELTARLKIGLSEVAWRPYELDKRIAELSSLLRREGPQRLAAEAAVELSADDPEHWGVLTKQPDTDSRPSLTNRADRQLPRHSSADANRNRLSKLAEIVPVAPASEAQPPVLDPHSLAVVERLGIGSWVEMHEPEVNPYRCKLAAIIKSIDKYIFVNRMGVKVAEKSKVCLAQHISDNTLRILDDGLLFDRALQSVIATLRK